MLEIYNEKVRDLFDLSKGDNRPVRMGRDNGFFVEDLTRSAVGSYEAIAKLLDAGTKARTVAATNMNATSSRAHTVFTIILTQVRGGGVAGPSRASFGDFCAPRGSLRPRSTARRARPSTALR